MWRGMLEEELFPKLVKSSGFGRRAMDRISSDASGIVTEYPIASSKMPQSIPTPSNTIATARSIIQLALNSLHLPPFSKQKV